MTDLQAALGLSQLRRCDKMRAKREFLARLDLPSGEHAYVACGPAHHHHLVCTACGRSTHVPDLGIGSVLRDASIRTGYRIERHRLELYGVCPDCQAPAEGATGATAPAGGRR